MKKILLLLMCIFLFGCSDKYVEWNTVTVEQYGTFKFPPEWKIERKDDFLYFYIVNEQGMNEYILVQYRNEDEVNDFFEDVIGVEKIEETSSEVFSNSCIISENKVIYKGGKTEELLKVSFTGNNYKSIDLIFLETSISKELAKDICKSYEMITK